MRIQRFNKCDFFLSYPSFQFFFSSYCIEYKVSWFIVHQLRTSISSRETFYASFFVFLYSSDQVIRHSDIENSTLTCHDVNRIESFHNNTMQILHFVQDDKEEVQDDKNRAQDYRENEIHPLSRWDSKHIFLGQILRFVQDDREWIQEDRKSFRMTGKRLRMNQQLVMLRNEASVFLHSFSEQILHFVQADREGIITNNKPKATSSTARVSGSARRPSCGETNSHSWFWGLDRRSSASLRECSLHRWILPSHSRENNIWLTGFHLFLFRLILDLLRGAYHRIGIVLFSWIRDCWGDFSWRYSKKIQNILHQTRFPKEVLHCLIIWRIIGEVFDDFCIVYIIEIMKLFTKKLRIEISSKNFLCFPRNIIDRIVISQYEVEVDIVLPFRSPPQSICLHRAEREEIGYPYPSLEIDRCNDGKRKMKKCHLHIIDQTSDIPGLECIASL